MHGAQALLGSELSPGQRDSAQMIEQAAGNALEMINRTLDTYKMEKGEYRLQVESFDLSALLRKVARQTEMAFAGRDLRVNLSLPGAPVHCLGEALLSYSMFNNALKNAAEASPPGARVTVDVAPGYGAVHVVVENRGEVAPAMREHFFSKYAPSDKVGGHGLGTYSIRLMAGVQGGDVAVDSGNGVTRLTITLPASWARAAGQSS
jgi:signal transduction histidine kinase